MSDKIRTINLTPEIIEGPWPRDDPGPQSIDDYMIDAPSPTTNGAKPSRAPIVAMSEDHIAKEFVSVYGEFLRYDHTRAKWFIWRETRWQADATQEVLDMIRQFCARFAAGADTATMQRKLTSVRNTRSVEEFSRIDRATAVASGHWDRDPFLMATPGGTIDLRTGLMRDARPQDMISRTCSVAPDATETCPQWIKFLLETCAKNHEQIEFLQKMAGYALTGDTREHALFFIYGPGGNGKSVFLNILMAIMHEYAITAPIETFTKSNNDNHPTELAMLDGARLVTASETEEGKRWAESRIKSLTGGDPISARFMRQDFFEFTPIFKLLIVGNHMPALGSVDDAARRRFRLVPFENKPAVVDKELEKKLRAEMPGIFRWMINGCIKWQMDGLNAPMNVRDATDKYFSDQDILQQWIDERCEFDINSRCDTGFAFSDWSAYATAAGEYVGKKKDLTSRLGKKGITCSPTRIDGKQVRVYNGLRLKFSQTI